MKNRVRDFMAVLDNNINLTSSASTSIVSSINDGLKNQLRNLRKEKRDDEIRDIICQDNSKFTTKKGQAEPIQMTSIESIWKQVTEPRLIDFSTWPDRKDAEPEREVPPSSVVITLGVNNKKKKKEKVYKSREERHSAAERRMSRRLRMREHEELDFQWEWGGRPGYEIVWRRPPPDTDSSEVSDQEDLQDLQTNNSQFEKAVVNIAKELGKVEAESKRILEFSSSCVTSCFPPATNIPSSSSTMTVLSRAKEAESWLLSCMWTCLCLGSDLLFCS